MNTTKYQRRITRNGKTVWARWDKGCKQHCWLMLQSFKPDDVWACSGAAIIAWKKEDLD